MFKRFITARTALIALSLWGIVPLIGCGDLSRQPIAPGRTTTLQKSNGSAASNDGPAYVVLFSQASAPSKTPVRAAKPTASRRDAGQFSPWRDGKLEVEFDDGNNDGNKGGDNNDNNGGNGARVQRATFEVRKGSLDRDAYITMTVYSGSTLGDIGVAFTPSGLRFNPSATLTLELQGDVQQKDLQGMTCYHIEGSAVTQIPVRVSSGGKDGLKLTIQVPGFSVYSLGDALVPETLGGW